VVSDDGIPGQCSRAASLERLLERGLMSKQRVVIVPTKDQYEAALAEIETMSRKGGWLHEFFGHVLTASDYEDAHGIVPNAITRYCFTRSKG